VRSTLPLVHTGTSALVVGLELRFEEGRIVDVQAEQGAEVIRDAVATDEQAPYLGEVALVDGPGVGREHRAVIRDDVWVLDA
jgi:aminopeptidase